MVGPRRRGAQAGVRRRRARVAALDDLRRHHGRAAVHRRRRRRPAHARPPGLGRLRGGSRPTRARRRGTSARSSTPRPARTGPSTSSSAGRRRCGSTSAPADDRRRRRPRRGARRRAARRGPRGARRRASLAGCGRGPHRRCGPAAGRRRRRAARSAPTRSATGRPIAPAATSTPTSRPPRRGRPGWPTAAPGRSHGDRSTARRYHDAGASRRPGAGATPSPPPSPRCGRCRTPASSTRSAAIEFRFAATADQFATIAKFRAARRLWARVADVAGGAGDGAARTAAPRRRCRRAMMTRYDPAVNMLRGTVACFAAGVAGADAITVLAVRPLSSAAAPSELGRRARPQHPVGARPGVPPRPR